MPDERAPTPRIPALIASGSDGVQHSLFVYATDNTLWFLDQVTNVWRSITAPPSTATAIDARDTVASSLFAFCVDDNIYVYDFPSDSWTALPQLPAQGA